MKPEFLSGRRNKRGFTLVEVVVVAVILGVLAITATLLYTGYINNARQDTVDNLAQTAAAAANSYFRKTNLPPDSASLNLFLPSPGKYTVTINHGASPRTVVITDVKYGFHGTATY
jgi:prepilin-type N-terminal cleavage/methylation domain-containing protein